VTPITRQKKNTKQQIHQVGKFSRDFFEKKISAKIFQGNFPSLRWKGPHQVGAVLCMGNDEIRAKLKGQDGKTCMLKLLGANHNKVSAADWGDYSMIHTQ
jgi:hypothetical protein